MRLICALVSPAEPALDAPAGWPTTPIRPERAAADIAAVMMRIKHPRRIVPDIVRPLSHMPLPHGSGPRGTIATPSALSRWATRGRVRDGSYVQVGVEGPSALFDADRDPRSSSLDSATSPPRSDSAKSDARAELYAALDLRLTYKPAERQVDVVATPRTVDVSACRRTALDASYTRDSPVEGGHDTRCRVARVPAPPGGTRQRHAVQCRPALPARVASGGTDGFAMWVMYPSLAPPA